MEQVSGTQGSKVGCALKWIPGVVNGPADGPPLVTVTRAGRIARGHDDYRQRLILSGVLPGRQALSLGSASWSNSGPLRLGLLALSCQRSVAGRGVMHRSVVVMASQPFDSIADSAPRDGLVCEGIEEVAAQ